MVETYDSDELAYLISLVNAELCGEAIPLAMAYKVPYNELAPEITDLKYSELNYNKLTERVLVYATPSDGMVIWLLPKR